MTEEGPEEDAPKIRADTVVMQWHAEKDDDAAHPSRALLKR